MRKLILFTLLILCCCLSYGQTKKFSHILITNDNGIADKKRLLALAENVKEVADRVSIMVSLLDQSGNTNSTVLNPKYHPTVEITCNLFDKKKNIAVYTLIAKPADCVMLGLNGFFGKDKPDLVLSGINNGSNTGSSWFLSGTVGAARMSAYLGVKAIAFSGFDSGINEAFSIIPNWIKEFISSGFIDDIGKNNYLTVAFPRKIQLKEIKGIKLAERRISPKNPENIIFKQILGKNQFKSGSRTIWTVEESENPYKPKIKKDEEFFKEGYIVITPMTIDENNNLLMNKLEDKTNLIPKLNLDVKENN